MRMRPPSCSVLKGVPRPLSGTRWATGLAQPGGGTSVADMRPKPGLSRRVTVSLRQQSWRALRDSAGAGEAQRPFEAAGQGGGVAAAGAAGEHHHGAAGQRVPRASDSSTRWTCRRPPHGPAIPAGAKRTRAANTPTTTPAMAQREAALRERSHAVSARWSRPIRWGAMLLTKRRPRMRRTTSCGPSNAPSEGHDHGAGVAGRSAAQLGFDGTHAGAAARFAEPGAQLLAGDTGEREGGAVALHRDAGLLGAEPLGGGLQGFLLLRLAHRGHGAQLAHFRGEGAAWPAAARRGRRSASGPAAACAEAGCTAMGPHEARRR